MVWLNDHPIESRDAKAVDLIFRFAALTYWSTAAIVLTLQGIDAGGVGKAGHPSGWERWTR